MSKAIDKNEIIKDGAIDSIIADFQRLNNHLSSTDTAIRAIAKSVGEIPKPDSVKDFEELTRKVAELEALYKKQLKTQEELTNLKKKYNQEVKRETQENEKTISTLKESNKAWREQTANIEENARALIGQKEELKSVRDRMKDIGAEISKIESFGATSESAKNRIVKLKEEMAALVVEEAQLKVSVSETNIMLKTQAKEMNAVDGSIDKANHTLGQMRKLWRQMTAEEKRSEFGQSLLRQIKELDEGLKEADAEIGNFQRNVGNYATAFKNIDLDGLSSGFTTLGRSLAVNNDRSSDLVQGINALSGVFGSMRNSMRLASSVLSSASTSFESLSKSTVASTRATRAATLATKGLTRAMNLIPIVAIVSGIISLIGWYQKLTGEKEKDLEVEKESNDEMERGNKLRLERSNSMRDINDLVNIAHTLTQSELKLLRSQIEAQMRLSETAGLDIKLAQDRINKEKEFIQEKRGLIKTLEDERKKLNMSTTAGKQEYQALTQLINSLKEEIVAKEELQKLSEKGTEITDDETKRLDDLAKSWEIVNSLIIDDTKNTKENNKAREKQKVSLEDINDALLERRYAPERSESEIFDSEVQAITKMMDREHAIRLKDINDFERERKAIPGLTAEDIKEIESIANEQRLLAEMDYLQRLRKLYKDYGDEYLDDIANVDLEISALQLEFSELFNTIAENEDVVNVFEEMSNSASNLTNTIKDLVNEREDIIIASENRIQQSSRTMISSLQKAAAEGNLQAKESILAEEKAIEESQKRIEKAQKRKQRMELISTGINTFNTKVASGKTGLQALAETGAEMTGLIALLNALPSFDIGADRLISKGQNIDGKGGFLAINHPDERILTAKQNKDIGFNYKNEEIIKIMKLYNKGILKPVNNSNPIVLQNSNEDILKSINDGFEKINNWNISIDELFGQISVIVEKSKNGNTHKFKRSYKS